MSEENHTLHIVKDHQSISMSIEDIFDTEKYNTFYGVTYTITPTFINKYLSDFETVELVVGIPEERVKQGANMAAKTIKARIESLLRDEPVQLYQQFSSEVKTKLKTRRITLLVPLAHVIHAKFCLLSNSITNETRLIVGSANLSEQAFSNSSNQYETILIWDNQPEFQVYNSYYMDTLNPILSNYLPSELLRLNTKKINDLLSQSEKIVDAVILLDNSETHQIKEKGINETLEDVEVKHNLQLLPDNTLEEMKNIYDARQQEIKQDREGKKIEETAYTLVKESISPRSKEPTI